LHPTNGHAETVFGPTAVSLGVFQQCLVLLGRKRTEGLEGCGG
jgi:hypothetical protein